MKKIKFDYLLAGFNILAPISLIIWSQIDQYRLTGSSVNFINLASAASALISLLLLSPLICIALFLWIAALTKSNLKIARVLNIIILILEVVFLVWFLSFRFMRISK